MTYGHSPFCLIKKQLTSKFHFGGLQAFNFVPCVLYPLYAYDIHYTICFHIPLPFFELKSSPTTVSIPSMLALSFIFMATPHNRPSKDLSNCIETNFDGVPEFYL